MWPGRITARSGRVVGARLHGLAEENIGWYVEPGYELTFRDGTRHHGLAIAGGLLIGR